MTEKRLLVEVRAEWLHGGQYNISTDIPWDKRYISDDEFISLQSESKKLEAQIQREVLEGLREKVDDQVGMSNFAVDKLVGSTRKDALEWVLSLIDSQLKEIEEK